MPSISNDPCNCASGSSSAWSGATYNIYANATETTTETSTVNQTVNTRYIDAVDVNADKVSCAELVLNGSGVSNVFQNITATPGNTIVAGNLGVNGNLSVDGTFYCTQPSLIDPIVTGDLYVDGTTTVTGSSSLQDTTVENLTVYGGVTTNGNITASSSNYIEFANQTIKYPLTSGLQSYTTSVSATVSLSSILNTAPSRITVSYYNIKTTGITGIPVLRINGATTGYKNRNIGWNAQSTGAAVGYTSTVGMPLGILAPTTGSNTWAYSGTIELNKISSTVWTMSLQGLRIVGTGTNYDAITGSGLYEGSAIVMLSLSTTNTDTFQTGGTISVVIE